MKRYLILIVTILVLILGVMVGCNSVPSSEPTTSDLQAQVETLQEELNKLTEQKKTEILQQADAYFAIVKLLPTDSSGEIKIVTGDEMVAAITEQLKASGKLWGLIKATEDPYLISLCQPNEWGQIPVSVSSIKDYSEGKYRELMSEYYSQQYIDEQLSMVEQAKEESAAQAAKEEADRLAAINNLPFTYTGKGSVRTPSFWTPNGSPNYQYKLTLTTTWDGGISINWYQENTSGSGASLITLKTTQVWQSTGISFGFPDSVEAGRTYEYIFNWNKSHEVVFFDIANVPADGEWTLTVSQIDVVTPRPKLDITLVVEYEGEWINQITTTSSWSITWHGGSGNTSRVFENIQIPWHYRAQRSDEGTDPLVLKIIYEGQVVAEDTAIGEDNEAWVYWEGPR